MLKIMIVALAFAALFAAQVKLPAKPSEAEVCSYNCLVSLQLANLDQQF
ncbi:MAG TPA: hypothetical protein VGG11_20915 [Xanthobacteraceae bacterium]